MSQMLHEYQLKIFTTSLRDKVLAVIILVKKKNDMRIAWNFHDIMV